MKHAIGLFAALPLVLISGGCDRDSFRPPPPVGTKLVYQIDPSANDEKSPPVDREQLRAVVERRVSLGAGYGGEVSILDDGRIQVGVYGDNPATLERMKRMLGAVGKLEFHIVADKEDHAHLVELASKTKGSGVLDPEREGDDKTVARWVTVLESKAESVRESKIYVTRDASKGKLEALVVEDDIHLTGANLREAFSSYDQYGQPCIRFTMDAAGSVLMGEITGNNLPNRVTGKKRLLAIILDGTLMTAPSVNSRITDSGEITGSFTVEEAADTAAILKAGMFPASIRLVSETKVAPK